MGFEPSDKKKRVNKRKKEYNIENVQYNTNVWG